MPDTVIVGGGVIGSSIAYHLARLGAAVTVYDPAGGPDSPSATWASAGGVRSQNRDPREWALTVEAAGRWPTLAEELEAPTGFRREGQLRVVERASDLPPVEERVRHERAAGIDVHMVGPAEMAELAPGLIEGLVGGSYTPGDGQADPPATARAFAGAARRHGASFHIEPVDTIEVRDGAVQGIVARGRSVPAGLVVLAAGAWSVEMASSAGLRLPIEAIALQMLLTDPGPPARLPTVTAEGAVLSLKQLEGGELLVGGGWPAAVDRDPLACHVTDQSRDGNWALAARIYPAAAERRIARSWCGVESRSLDGVPLLGPLERPRGLWVAVGFSGHGFQLSPAIGRALADQLAGKSVPALDGLSAARAAGETEART
ncbi:FAD-binding oxidoreductase [Candidatus Nephthysia bennettiae]|uniref:FAD-binding oxidoreductase n=1 Tax=Candidatus Nephthysia bennettiae TaxID=3127016 RepID=A0A934KBF6_9BACT|nr:FAD-binding oxidoreductase [Candidatus Dormibacteraeota bacterium]MBJ7612411.1 FAD-binding oxidoreductase [Candidatus Dormibacteraeota bacterium]